MSEIILTEPIPSHGELERLHLFAGRHLGEDEFEHQQAYVDSRIAPLLGAMNPGIVNGLQVRTQQQEITGESFTVSSGLAIAGNGNALGLYYPLRINWSTLIENYLAETESASAAGVFYLTLRRSSRYVDHDPAVSACQRHEFDPLRDAQRVVIGSIGLTRLAIEPSEVNNSSRELIENWVAANNVEGTVLTSMDDAVPLGLLAIGEVEDTDEELPHYEVKWFSEAAGRFMAVPNSGYHVLLKQMTEAFRRTLLGADAAVDDSESVAEFLDESLRLDFLPAAGELPQEILSGMSTTTPSISWLPKHLGIDMVAVPEESVDEMIERHLPRNVIDLRQPAGDRIRLLIAVNEPDYTPDLLDFPQTDKKLESDVFRYFMRSHKSWQDWMRQYNYLYALVEENLVDESEIKALGLPEPVDAPELSKSFYADVISDSKTELGVDDDENALYPYSEGIPDYPQFYMSWGVANTDDDAILPPALETPEQDGLVIKYTLAIHDMEALDNEIRAFRSRVEKTRDYILLQRQQLDSQTVSLSALAGGVAGDGSGLQVARWLPFTKLTVPEKEEAGGATEETTETKIKAGQANIALDKFSLLPTSFIKGLAVKSTASAYQSDFLEKGKSVFSSTLRKSPTVYSAVQYNLNNARLNKIAEIPRKALTKPSFEAKEFRFGVLEHIRPEYQEYNKILRGMNELLSTLDGLFDLSEAKSIKTDLKKFGQPKSLDELKITKPSTVKENLEQVPILNEAMFEAGKILIKQIAYMESRYARLESILEGRLRSRIRMEGEIEKLVAMIKTATERLESLDKRRIEYLGDYGVSQRLLDEDWLAIYNLNLERTRILTTGVRGLYYVRVRQTPISMSLVDPLEMRYGKSSDIVPGCNWSEDPELPEELEDFFDTVLEVPMNDWSRLKKLKVYVPPVKRLDYIYAIRKTRFKSKALRKTRHKSRRTRRSPVNVSLANVRVQMQSVLFQMSKASFPITQASAKKRQKETAKVMSLEDVLSGTRGHLQKQGQILRNRLEQAVDCMLETLGELPPSLRLQWAQLAEDDRLRVDRVELWPGLEKAERDDFNATRTLSELVEWWFRQLDKRVSAEGRSAMRNMVRACVIHSALGDPDEILHGQVYIPPRRLALGETLRIHLNRPANPGTVLQLMDVKQRVVAMLNVSDDDAKGTVASISKVTRKDAVITSQYRVVASKLTRYMRY